MNAGTRRRVMMKALQAPNASPSVPATKNPNIGFQPFM